MNDCLNSFLRIFLKGVCISNYGDHHVHRPLLVRNHIVIPSSNKQFSGDAPLLVKEATVFNEDTGLPKWEIQSLERKSVSTAVDTEI